MDPLTVLREFNVNKELQKIRVEDSYVHFGDRYSFAKTVPTTFKSQNGKGDFYTLETLLFFLQNRTLGPQDYMKHTREGSVPSVNFIDRKVLLGYLDGQVDAASVPHIADSAPLPIFAEEPAKHAKRPREPELDDEGGPLKVLLAQERQLRNRNTMLLAPNRNFTKVITILRDAERKARHLQQARQQQQQQPRSGSARPGPPGHHHHGHHSHHGHHHASQHQRHHTSSGSARPPPEQARPVGAIPVKPSGRFERDATQEQLRAMGGEAATKLSSMINIYGGDQPAAARAAPPAPPPGPPGSAQKVPAGAAPGSSSRPASGQAKPGQRPSSGGANPIILVPPGMSALFNKYNAPLFLDRGVFMPSASAKASGGDPPQSVVNAPPAKDGRPRQFTVVERLEAKSPDWQRVVAVICQGAKWQFKDWPFKGAAKGELVDTFSRVAGFYIHYADEAIPELVRSWNVKCMPLPRSSRHQDAPLRLEFFRHLDHFLAARKAR